MCAAPTPAGALMCTQLVVGCASARSCVGLIPLAVALNRLAGFNVRILRNASVLSQLVANGSFALGGSSTLLATQDLQWEISQAQYLAPSNALIMLNRKESLLKWLRSIGLPHLTPTVVPLPDGRPWEQATAAHLHVLPFLSPSKRMSVVPAEVCALRILRRK